MQLLKQYPFKMICSTEKINKWVGIVIKQIKKISQAVFASPNFFPPEDCFTGHRVRFLLENTKMNSPGVTSSKTNCPFL